MEEITEPFCFSVLTEHTQDVKHVKWIPRATPASKGPEYQMLASCSYDNSIRIWDFRADNWVCLQVLNDHDSTVWALDFSPSGHLMFSVSDDKTIRVFKRNPDLKTFSPSQVVKEAHERPIYTLSVSSDGKLLATGGGDDSINIYSVVGDSVKLLSKIEGAHESDVNCVAFNPKNPSELASCSDACDGKVWTISSI